MTGRYTLKYVTRGRGYALFSISCGQAEDFDIAYGDLQEKDRKKVAALLEITADYGPGTNVQKWKPLEKGLFEMKSGQIRMPFFYHGTLRNTIVITHIFFKKQRRCPVSELQKARDRKALGERLVPE